MRKTINGFTIVELLIVIVVIAILATISVVAYTGIQNRTNDSAVQADLRNIANKLEVHNAEWGAYPIGDAELLGLNLKATKGSHGQGYHLVYCHPLSSNNNTYALVAESKSGSWFQYGGSGAGVYTGPHTITSTELCTAAGAPIPSGTPPYRTFLYHQTDGWKSYIGS